MNQQRRVTMNNEYKVSPEIKWTFILNVLLFITGFAFNEQIIIAASVIIFSILSVGVQILEAINLLTKESNND